MIRIAKLTDYAIVLLVFMARAAKGAVHAARDLADESGLPLPTVSKVLKCLSREGLVASHRGARGGYTLARAAAAIRISEIIAAMEGPVAVTECSGNCKVSCELERTCPVRDNWQVINDVVQRSLANFTLADMAHPLSKAPAARQSGKRVNLRLTSER